MSGERTRIAMTDRSDTFSIPECHYRWGGLSASSGTFMQAGTMMCQDFPPGQWKTFCYGWDDNRAFTTWMFFESTTTTDSAYHTYSVAGDPGSYLYKCKKDSTTLYTNIADHVAFTGKLDAIVEIGTNQGEGLDPAKIWIGTNHMGRAIEYLSGGVWSNAPTQSFYSWAWDSGNVNGGENACLNFKLGIDYSSLYTPVHSIYPGENRTCRNTGDSAW
jgi:hypothetical protein